MSARRVEVGKAAELLGISREKLGSLIAEGRLPRPIEYRVPRHEPFDYFERPAFERALRRIAGSDKIEV